MMRSSLALVGPDAGSRDALRSILERDARLAVVGEARNGHEALDTIDVHRPHLALITVELPGLSGFHIAATLRRHRSVVPVVLVAKRIDDDIRERAVAVGAAGLLAEDAAPATVLEAVHATLRGQSTLSAAITARPHLMLHLLDRLRHDDEEAAMTNELASLTLREVEVLDCLVMGFSNQQTAEALFLAEQTVKNYVSSLLRKLHARNRTAALRHALVRGWADIGPGPAEAALANA